MINPTRPTVQLRLPTQPFVLVTVGTDHHPFDRLVRWVERWAAENADHRCFMQYGTANPPAIPTAAAYLDYELLAAGMARAAVVVCHGGPATIIEARGAGRIPIVIPRDPRRGEHVDDHQMRFAARLHAEGDIVVVDSQDQLDAALERALSHPEEFVVSDGHGSQDDALQQFEEVLMAAMNRPGTRWSRRRQATASAQGRGGSPPRRTRRQI